MRKLFSRPSRNQVVLLAVVVVLAVIGYLAGKAAWIDWRFRSAVQAERSRDFEVAQRELGACLRQRPDEPRLMLLAARLGWRSRLDDLMPADGWDAPLRKHLKAAESDPLLIERVTREEELIDALSGRLDDVAGMLSRRLKEGDENEVPILEVLTWSNIVLHRFPAAARAADTLLARQPDHNRGHYWRGLVRELTHGANGLPDDDYRRAVELAPQDTSLQLRLAQALARNLETRPEALALFEKLAQERPQDAEIQAGLGRCRLELGNVTSAIPALRAALALTRANGEVMANLGRAMLEAGDAAGAEPVLRQSVVLAPNARLSNFYLGQCLSQLGRQQDAKPFLEAATRIYADTQRVGELSRQLFQRGSASPEERCQLGELLCRTGHRDLGEYWIRSALVADPGYEPARRALASLRSPTR
jgi:tetratricopeptide (TPR) repeat protein